MLPAITKEISKLSPTKYKVNLIAENVRQPESMVITRSREAKPR